MDPEENGGDAMNRIYRKNPFWSLAGPLLGYMAIQWAIQFAAELVICFPYMIQAYFEILQKQQPISPAEMTDIYFDKMQPALDIFLKYQVEIGGLAALGTLVLSVILFRKDRKLEKNLRLEAEGKIPFSGYWPLSLFAAAGCIAATCLTAMVQMAFYDAAYAQTSEEMYAAVFVVQILSLGIVVPAAEEMMFRGVLFRRFRENRSFAYSAFASALFFSFMHVNTVQIIYAFLLGLLLAYVYEKYGSVYAPLLLHILLNTFSIIFTEIGVFRWIGQDIMRIAAVTIAGTFVCSVLFALIQKKKGAVYPGRQMENKEIRK